MFISVPPLQYFQLVPESKKPITLDAFSRWCNQSPTSEGTGPSPTWMSSSPDSGSDNHAQLPLCGDSLLPYLVALRLSYSERKEELLALP